MTTAVPTSQQLQAQALAAVIASPTLHNMMLRMIQMHAQLGDETFSGLMRQALACAYLDGYRDAHRELRK